MPLLCDQRGAFWVQICPAVITQWIRSFKYSYHYQRYFVYLPVFVFLIITDSLMCFASPQEYKPEPKGRDCLLEKYVVTWKVYSYCLLILHSRAVFKNLYWLMLFTFVRHVHFCFLGVLCLLRVCGCNFRHDLLSFHPSTVAVFRSEHLCLGAVCLAYW